MKSWKIGAVSGLIAGIIGGIIWGTTNIGYSIFGIPFFGFPPIPYPSVLFTISIFLMVGIFIGIVDGIIYSKAYNVIPGKNILKGIIFGLFGYSILNLRFATIEASYGRFFMAADYIFNNPLGAIVFGITLAILFEALSGRYHVPKGKKVIEYKMMSGLLPGAIAGLIGGMATFVTITIGIITGFWAWIPEQITDIGFLISQFGAQTFFHFVWCTFMGVIFPKVYNLIPGKRILKGFYYGLIAFLLTEGFMLPFSLFYSYYWRLKIPLLSEALLFGVKQMILLGLTVWIVFGIVLGYLYKPTK